MLLVDLFCGRGGWSKAAIARGWSVVGYDIEDHGYPGLLVRTPLPIPAAAIAERKPDLVVASPPCEEYARYHLPWIKSGKAPDETLLRWSISLIGQVGCDVVVECSRFAGWHVPGGFYVRPYTLWGDVPAIMPSGWKSKDARRGSSALPRLERSARAAEIPEELAGWIIDVVQSRSENSARFRRGGSC